MSEWTKFSEAVPQDGAKFVVMWADGSGSYAYLMKCGEVLGAEDGMSEPVSKFRHGDIWALLPDDFEFWFMRNNFGK